IIGICAQAQIENQQETNTNTSQFLIPGNSPYLTVNSGQTQTSENMNYSVNLNLSRETDTAGSVFTADMDLAGYTSDAYELNNNVFNDSLGDEVRPAYLFRNQTPIDVKIFSGRMDYMYVTDSSFFIETGIKASHVTNNNTFLADTGYAGSWVPDYNRTNRFIYTETIGAAYVQANKTFRKLTLQAGLRAELTDYDANSVTTGRRDKKTYLSVFPTLFTLYPIDSANVLSFSLTRRIGRPSYQSLNPFSWYIDPFTQFSGNSFLRPSFSNNAEIKWAHRERLFTSFSYSFDTKITDNVIIQQAATQTTTNLTANIGFSHFAGININRTFTLSSFCTADLLVSGSVNKIVSDYPGYSFDRFGWYGEVDADFTFLLPKDFKLVSSLFYTVPSQNGIMKIRSNYGLSLVLRHTFSDNRGSISLRMNNIIGQNAFRAHVVNEDLDIVWENQWEARRIMLSFTWKFGRKTVKEKREHDGASQDERNRVNTN
ncbi:MAG: outer membrane beta-barrel family protein, partial [Bacteroidia bacterium]